jgi:hypothetical protein
MRLAALILAALVAPSLGSAARAGHGEASFVAGFADDHAAGWHRYWGGPYFVVCPGYPPYETHRMSCRRSVKVVARHHRRHVKVRLK